MGDEEKRVRPDVLVAGLLDEIAQRLMAVEQLMREQVPEGVVEPIEPVSVTDEVRRVTAPVKPWFDVVVVNDGPGDVYVIVNPDRSYDWHRVPMDETYRVDMKRGIIKDVLLRCDPGGAASVRLVGSR
jgi:hypothetical protein